MEKRVRRNKRDREAERQKGAGCLMGMDFIPGAINILKLKTIVTLLNVTRLCT